MHAVVVGQLGVERHREHRPLTRGHRMAVDLGEDLHVRAVLGDPGRADEDRPQRPAPVDAARSSMSASKLLQLTPERVALARACPSGRGARGRA